MEKEPTAPKNEKKIGGRKFWDPAMQVDKEGKIDKIPENFQPEIEAENRLKMLEKAMDVIKNQLTDTEKQKIKAIILFGSTARGAVMHPRADLDMHIDLEPYDDDLFKKIKEIIHEQISNIDLDFTSKNIKEGGRTAKLLTAQKYPDKPVKWKFLYSRNEKEESELNDILSEKLNK